MTDSQLFLQDKSPTLHESKNYTVKAEFYIPLIGVSLTLSVFMSCQNFHKNVKFSWNTCLCLLTVLKLYIPVIHELACCCHFKYEVLLKNSENLTIKKFILTPSFHRLLRSSSLGHVYSDPSVFPMISRIRGSFQICVDNLLRFCVNLLSRVKTTPFQP